MNLYAYAHNDPINLYDPSGMSSECPTDVCRTASQIIELYKTAIQGMFQNNESAEGNEDSGNAAQDLPDLTDVDGEKANGNLTENGFENTKSTEGGYEQWDHEDGSRVWVRPNGEIVRSGPKRPQVGNSNAKHVRDRYGLNGNLIPHRPGGNTHTTGEIIKR